MGIFNNFPFTNFQEKNLDCIYKLAKEANTNAADAREHVNEALTNTDSLIERTTALTEQAAQLTEAVESGEVIKAKDLMAQSAFYFNSWPVDNTAEMLKMPASGFPKVVTLCNNIGLDPANTNLVGSYFKTDSLNADGTLRTARVTALMHLEPISGTREHWDNARKYLIELIWGFTTSYVDHYPGPQYPAQLTYNANIVNVYDLSSLVVNL